VRHFCLLAALGGVAGLSGPARGSDAFPLTDGDRVVLVGNTLVEREQDDGYWETALTRRYPTRSVLFRNLGWSGDTVFGHARAGFGTTADGFRHLRDQVLATRPTVILVGYGSNEAFDGPSGLPAFVRGLDTLLDALAPARARMVLLSPLRQEELGRPLPDPAGQNRNLRLYADAIRETARKRGLGFVDLYDLLGDGARATPPAPLTDNGIHLTAWGYWRSAPLLEKGLGLARPTWLVEVDAAGKGLTARGTRIDRLEGAPLRFRVTDEMLPLPPAPVDGAPRRPVHQEERVLRVKGLAAGFYTLTVDGQAVARAPAGAWGAGVVIRKGPEFEQAKRLRAAVVAKNRLYFHRWRPQNETYLFGFRNHEQGQNAVEVPRFDPLVAGQEKVIARLRVPVAHTYELKREAR
jgi:lysophospholipase L1-like esterase